LLFWSWFEHYLGSFTNCFAMSGVRVSCWRNVRHTCTYKTYICRSSFVLKFYLWRKFCVTCKYLGEIEVCLGRLGGDWCSCYVRVGGEEQRDRPGGDVAVKHVGVQIPRLDIDSWQVVPAYIITQNKVWVVYGQVSISSCCNSQYTIKHAYANEVVPAYSLTKRT